MEIDDLIRTIPGYDPFVSAGDCHFDADAARRAIDFVETYLTFSKDSAKSAMGSPFVLQPWQKAIVGNLFGWIRPDGTRRYREAFILIPRKNGKTELAAAIIAYVGLCDRESGAEIYSAAADRMQASIVFAATKSMISANRKLSKRCKVYQNSIQFPKSSFYKSLSAEAYSKHGLNAHLVVIDELHAITDTELVSVLTSSQGARRQPLTIYITTADFNRPGTYADTYKRATQCRDAKSPSDVNWDPYLLPCIWEAKADEDWTSETVWRKCNPNCDVSVQLEYLRAECKKAQDNPTLENKFKRLHLNLSTEADVRWLSSSDWNACGGLPFDKKVLVGKRCIGTLDLSSTADLSCYLLYFPEYKLVLPHFFAPRENAERRERLDKVPYLTWAKQGYITLTDGNVIDYDYIKAEIVKSSKEYQVEEIAYDPWGAAQIAIQLQALGFNMVEFRQGWNSMSEPAKEFERIIKKHELVHLDNPILKWNAMNVSISVQAEGENIKPSKAKSVERIDGIVCAVMAIGRSMLKQAFKSTYSNNEVMFV